MKSINLTLVTVGIFFLLLAAAVNAGSIVSVENSTNVDGYIGLGIKNELDQTIYTNNEGYSAAVLYFKINDTNVSIIVNESQSRINPGKVGIVVLNQTWPTTKYTRVQIGYDDGTGGTYPEEIYFVFAKPGLTIKEVSVSPKEIFSNESFTLTLRVRAEGEGLVSFINAQVTNDPEYYKYQSQSVPSTMRVGDEANFTFKFTPKSNQAMPDTMITKGTHIPIKIFYDYLDKSDIITLNESIIILNSRKAGGHLPEVEATVEAPDEVKKGATFNASAFTWNTNLGEHSACEVKFILNVSTSAIDLPLHTKIPGIELEPTDIVPTNSNEEFELGTGTTPLGTYTLTLTVEYDDCEWHYTRSTSATTTFKVVETLTENETEEEPEEEEVTEEEPEEEEEIILQEDEGIHPTFYVALVVVAVIVVLVMIYGLYVRSRYI